VSAPSGEASVFVELFVERAAVAAPARQRDQHGRQHYRSYDHGHHGASSAKSKFATKGKIIHKEMKRTYVLGVGTPQSIQ